MISDPINSPYPIPWQWILQTHYQLILGELTGGRLYRTPSLYSPQGNYAAYSRIRLQPQRELHQSRVTSVMFVEDLQTGILKTITANSPLAPHPFQQDEIIDAPGIIATLMPVSWSLNGDRLLARQFEGFLCSGDVSDYGVIWDSRTEKTVTLCPTEDLDYTHAILLGWSQYNPEDILFRAGSMGEEDWGIWAVAMDGTTYAAQGDQAIAYGNPEATIWSGPQGEF